MGIKGDRSLNIPYTLASLEFSPRFCRQTDAIFRNNWADRNNAPKPLRYGEEQSLSSNSLPPL